MVSFICPDCRISVSEDSGKRICSHCQKEYVIRNGITCFNETDQYYGELSQPEMQEFLKLAELSDWESAVSTYLPSRNPGLIRTTNDPKRTSWVSLLNLKGNETVLDFGCGLGGVSVQLAGRVGQVVAIDGCYDRIRFLQIRKDQR